MSFSSQRLGSAVSHGPFRQVVCAVDGSRGSAVAIRQALSLCHHEAQVRFVAVTDVRGTGANRMASLGEHRAGQALAAARALARDHALAADVELVHDDDVVEVLLARAADSDLLALGCHGHSRLGGMLTGATATSVVHGAHGTVLVARPTPRPEAFPSRILVATAAHTEHESAVELAGRLGDRPGAHIDLLHLAKWDYGPGTRRRLAVLATRLQELSGVEPVVRVTTGATPYGIVEGARDSNADLVVMGRRGLSGIRALDSVSESVVHHAACSVLIASDPSTR